MDFSGSFTIENSVEAKKLHTKTKKKIRNSYSLAKKIDSEGFSTRTTFCHFYSHSTKKSKN